MRIRSAILALALATSASGEGEPPQYSPYADQEHANRVFWGDTHVHTSWSPDAGAGGNLRLGPDTAYRFARGETITAHNGTRVALRRPLDFLVVADHSEYLGIYPMLEAGLPALLATETGARWAEYLRKGERARVGQEYAAGMPEGRDLVKSLPFQRTVWEQVGANADRYDQPGVFTAFIGYEWTSTPDDANLHRVVLFADDASTTSQVVPFRSFDSEDPEDLWRWLADYERTTGGRVLAIPHNSNVSAGRMFELHTYDGRPFDRAYAEQRTRWEPLVEVTQIKGDSETAPFLSPDDEFVDIGNRGERAGMSMDPNDVHTDDMWAGEYVRAALGNGVGLAEELGANPFEFGLIGSTDSHTGLATADEGDFWGKFSANEPRPGRAARPLAEAFMPPDAVEKFDPDDSGAAANVLASGLAAVWARENSRAALFDAMRRRETYATTGPRMQVRFFGGWDFSAVDAMAPDLARRGYAAGVPMGGELPARPRGGVPRFLVAALRDPDGANLDRIQIVKQWSGSDGQRRERVYDVVVSGERSIAADGRCREAVGNTVDLETARYTNSIGAPQLLGVWRDPDFDPERRAVYYLRVLEIPTPRWTTYDAVRFGTPLPKSVPATHQERAYTSPIWYRGG